MMASSSARTALLAIETSSLDSEICLTGAEERGLMTSRGPRQVTAGRSHLGSYDLLTLSKLALSLFRIIQWLPIL